LPRGREGASGNLFAVALVVIPESASAEETLHWQALAACSKFKPR
jgi:hypothetical protein